MMVYSPPVTRHYGRSERAPDAEPEQQPESLTERKAREMRETWAAQEQWKKETGDKRRERAEKREREAAASLQSEPDKENQPAEPAAEAAEPYEESQRF